MKVTIWTNQPGIKVVVEGPSDKMAVEGPQVIGVPTTDKPKSMARSFDFEQDEKIE